MPKVWTIVVVVAGIGIVGAPSSARAQSADDPSASQVTSHPIAFDIEQLLWVPDLTDTDAARRAELALWMDDFTAWQVWSAEWGNRRERGWFTQYRERREKPAPPPWLAERCTTVFDDGDPLRSACGLLAEWNEDPVTAQVRGDSAVAQAQGEDTPTTIWWEHVHVDALWPALQWQAGVYGVVGTHATTTVKGRLQVFIAPGVMFLNMPARNGGRVWKFAANYGIGYRLAEFSFLAQRQAVLHVNLAKAWVMSDVSDVVSGRTMDFVGFSLTFKTVR
jgi:hypothetical protein